MCWVLFDAVEQAEDAFNVQTYMRQCLAAYLCIYVTY